MRSPSLAALLLASLALGCGPQNKNGEDCTNGVDDNGDSLIDCGDPACDPVCQGALCGDGVLDAGEACDDGNTQGGDGCNPFCNLEGGGGQPDELDTALGCQGVFNPDQVLDYHITLPDADFAALKADTTNSVYFEASFRCQDGPEQIAGVRRKRSGSLDKPGLKVDFNLLVPGGDFFGLKKLSLENGVSEGSSAGERKDVLSEYLSWRIMVLSGALSGRAAFARVFVNGALLGVYTNVEQVDKRFLRSRLGDDSGWLFKKSGSTGDGYKTNEGIENPFEADLCFFHDFGGNTPCTTPPADQMEAYLLEHLDVTQMLLFGGINALIANSDSPLGKDNNYYFYDSALFPRIYLPWDLDTVMKDNPPLFGSSVPGGTNRFTSALFGPFEDDLDLLLTGLLEGPLSLDAILAELDRAQTVAGAALDADPALGGGSTADSVASLESYWINRHAQLVAELEAH